MAARDKRRTDIAKFLDTVRGMRIPPGSPNQQAIWVILAHHGTKDGATRACERLWKRYISVNEFRVARVREVAEIIGPYVKNDPLVAVDQARGFLRRFFAEFQKVDPTVTESLTVDQLKKQLAALDSFGREIALSLALHYCRKEAEPPPEPDPESGPAADKPKKRPEKDLTLAANRLRLLFAFSAYGSVTVKSMQANASRAFARSWAFRSLPKPKPAPAKKAPVKAPKPAPAKKKPVAGTKPVVAKKKTVVAKKKPPVVARKKTVARKKAPAKKKPVAKKKPARKR